MKTQNLVNKQTTNSSEIVRTRTFLIVGWVVVPYLAIILKNAVMMVFGRAWQLPDFQGDWIIIANAYLCGTLCLTFKRPVATVLLLFAIQALINRGFCVAQVAAFSTWPALRQLQFQWQVLFGDIIALASAGAILAQLRRVYDEGPIERGSQTEG